MSIVTVENEFKKELLSLMLDCVKNMKKYSYQSKPYLDQFVHLKHLLGLYSSTFGTNYIDLHWTDLSKETNVD
jgi:hypothetical protein